MLGGAALACVAAACAWTICVNAGANPTADLVAVRGDSLPFAASRGDRLVIAGLPGPADTGINSDPFDSRFSAAFPPGVFLGTASFADDEATAAAASSRPQNILPQGRRLARSESPGRFLQPRQRHAGQQDLAAADAPVAERPSLFERVFGTHPPAIFERLFGPSSPKVTLAYAAPEGVAADGNGVTSGLYDRQTAVYDIAAHTVYMPDGTALEAHSGLGSLLDQPSYVNAKDRGPTPPDIYDLQPRGQLFHGVRALRLIPVDQTKVFGRSGLLAHSYMLGPNGQSNGCVSFRDYDAFLQAYENHEITRLAVVSHID
jgi:hypothetical protein